VTLQADRREICPWYGPVQASAAEFLAGPSGCSNYKHPWAYRKNRFGTSAESLRRPLTVRGLTLVSDQRAVPPFGFVSAPSLLISRDVQIMLIWRASSRRPARRLGLFSVWGREGSSVEFAYATLLRPVEERDLRFFAGFSSSLA
jgi:hypothetical protein